MSEFHEIPGWPAYMVNEGGRVKSHHGELKSDYRGRFHLYNAQTRTHRALYARQLLVLAGLLKPEKTAPPKTPAKRQTPKPAPDQETQARLAEMEAELARSRRSLAYLRKLNATLWSRLRRLDSEPVRGKKARAKRTAEEEAEWHDLTVSLAEEAGVDFAEYWDE